MQIQNLWKRELVRNFKFNKKGEETPTIRSIPSQSSRVVCRGLEVQIPHLEFTIEIESNSLMYNPNKAIRDRVFPFKTGKFSVNYYTFEELQR